MTTTLTPEASASKAKRISNCALTHEQGVEDIMLSLTFAKGTDRLAPIVENAARTIIKRANDLRLTRAANQCIGGLDQALNETYVATASYSDGWVTLSEGPDCCYIRPTTDEQGNILKEGRWVFESDDYETNQLLNQLQLEREVAVDKVELEQAIASVNSSMVFKAAEVEFILTDDLLVYGGSTKV